MQHIVSKMPHERHVADSETAMFGDIIITDIPLLVPQIGSLYCDIQYRRRK